MCCVQLTLSWELFQAFLKGKLHLNMDKHHLLTFTLVIIFICCTFLYFSTVKTQLIQAVFENKILSAHVYSMRPVESMSFWGVKLKKQHNYRICIFVAIYISIDENYDI